MWHFDRLPENELENVKHFLEQKDVLSLNRLHDQYKLSDYFYSSCCDSKSLFNYFKKLLHVRANH